MSGHSVPGRAVTAGPTPAPPPSGGPTAEQGMSAAPTQAGDHWVVGVADQCPRRLTDGASADCAGFLGTSVQSAKLGKMKTKMEKKEKKKKEKKEKKEKKKEKKEKRKATESGNASFELASGTYTCSALCIYVFTAVLMHTLLT